MVAAAVNDESTIIVTGLPRSGTSMVMQMLAAGGTPTLGDGVRAADESNPRGYFEYEPVKRLSREADWLPLARGKAVKVVAPLVRYLPPSEKYAVILIDRDVDEVLDSQQRMLERLGAPPADSAARRGRLRDEFVRQLADVRSLLASWPATRVLELQYAAAVGDAGAAAASINAFLGGELDVEAMTRAVDGRLYRTGRRQSDDT